MVVGVGLCIGALNLGVNRRRGGQFWEEESLGLSIVTNGIVCVRGGEEPLLRDRVLILVVGCRPTGNIGLTVYTDCLLNRCVPQEDNTIIQFLCIFSSLLFIKLHHKESS